MVYSNCCCSCSFEPEIIKIGHLSHKMYSNNILNFQESTNILNAHTKKVWKLIEGTTFIGSMVVILPGMEVGTSSFFPIKYFPRHAQIYSLWQPSPTPGRPAGLVIKPGGPVSTCRRRLIRWVIGALKPVSPGRWCSSAQ